MPENTEKRIIPPYIAYKAFDRFINGLRESGIPQQIDRSIFPTMSGAAQSSLIAALRYLNLIDNQQKPTQNLKQLVDSSGEDYSKILANILHESYWFLTQGDIHLDRATGQQVADKFREQGTTGSTVTKCIAFFLTAARAANLKVSHHVRPPKPIRVNAPRKQKRGSTGFEDENVNVYERDEESSPETIDPDMERIVITIPGKKGVIVQIPKNFTSDDWDFLTTILGLYQKRIEKGGNP